MTEHYPTSTIDMPAEQDDDPLAIGYVEGLGGNRTARHAAEALAAPKRNTVMAGTAKIRRDIKNAFAEYAEDERVDTELEELKAEYWQRASKVGVEHGAKPGFELDDYFNVGPERSYDQIRASIEHDYPEDSIPRSVLEGIDAYHEVLGINPAHAATITTELVGRGLPQIDAAAREAMEHAGCTEEAAITQAFAAFIDREVPYHINSIIDKHGYGDEAVTPHFAKRSFYPPAEADKEDVALKMSVEDIKGLIRVYDIQSRPYTQEELDGANDLAHDPVVQATLIKAQERLVDFSRSYLEKHPERAESNLSNFSEIFVPERGEDGLELLPNPKLLRAMVNNVLPGVAKSLFKRGASLTEVTSADITAGVNTAARTYRLFNVNIGQFENFSKEDDTAELHAFYKVVCPAGNLFPNFLAENLGSIYDQERERQELLQQV